jgi:hypothetical protein
MAASCCCWLLLPSDEASTPAAAACACAAVGVAASGVPVVGVGGPLVLKLRSSTNSLPLRLLCACGHECRVDIAVMMKSVGGVGSALICTAEQPSGIEPVVCLPHNTL